MPAAAAAAPVLAVAAAAVVPVLAAAVAPVLVAAATAVVHVSCERESHRRTLDFSDEGRPKLSRGREGEPVRAASWSVSPRRSNMRDAESGQTHYHSDEDLTRTSLGEISSNVKWRNSQAKPRGPRKPRVTSITPRIDQKVVNVVRLEDLALQCSQTFNTTPRLIEKELAAEKAASRRKPAEKAKAETKISEAETKCTRLMPLTPGPWEWEANQRTSLVEHTGWEVQPWVALEPRLHPSSAEKRLRPSASPRVAGRKGLTKIKGEYKKPPTCAPPPTAPSSSAGAVGGSRRASLSASVAECDEGSDLEDELPSEFAFGLNVAAKSLNPPLPTQRRRSISGFPSLVFSIADADDDEVDMPVEFAHQLGGPGSTAADPAAWPTAGCCVARPGPAKRQVARRGLGAMTATLPALQ